MKNQFLEAGQIVNTHGIQGEVKIVPWCDSPEFLLQFGTLYLDGTPVRVRAARVHKGNVLAALEGVADVNAAMALKGKIVSIDRSGVVLPEGRHFIADLLGLEVLDAGSGEKHDPRRGRVPGGDQCGGRLYQGSSDRGNAYRCIGSIL